METDQRRVRPSKGHDVLRGRGRMSAALTSVIEVSSIPFTMGQIASHFQRALANTALIGFPSCPSGWVKVTAQVAIFKSAAGEPGSWFYLCSARVEDEVPEKKAASLSLVLNAVASISLSQLVENYDSFTVKVVNSVNKELGLYSQSFSESF